MWDLRFATAPMRILEHHKRGVLSIAWCPQDSDLLLSAAKDNQVLCWNPNSEQPGGEVGIAIGCGFMFTVLHSKKESEVRFLFNKSEAEICMILQKKI